jgi:hypothetical protein
MFQLMMRTEMVFEMLVYSPFIHTHTHIYIYTHTHIYTHMSKLSVSFLFSQKSFLNYMHACMHRYIFRAFTSRNIWQPATWVRVKPRPPRYAAEIAMLEYGLALSITHSSLDHKKSDTAEFLVLYMFIILWLHFLYVKMQRIFFKHRWCLLTKGHQLSLTTFQETPQILLFIIWQKGVLSYEAIHSIAQFCVMKNGTNSKWAANWYWKLLC